MFFIRIYNIYTYNSFNKLYAGSNYLDAFNFIYIYIII